MAGQISRTNGQKGGRPQGSENAETKARREIKRRWLACIEPIADSIFQAQLDLALGSYNEVDTPQGKQRKYTRLPDGKAVQWILEQVLGKASQSVSDDTDEKTDTNEYNLSPEQKKSIERAIEFAMPSSHWKTNKANPAAIKI